MSTIEVRNRGYNLEVVTKAYQQLFMQAAAGLNGKSVLNGTGAPDPDFGKNGDFYVDTDTYDIYGPKNNSGWGDATSLQGNPFWGNIGGTLTNQADLVSALAKKVSSIPTGIPGAAQVTNLVFIHLSDYNAITVKDPNTLYIIV